MNSTSNTVVDPVCGMTIDTANAVGSSKHAGETYYFCSRGCEAKFDAAPERYRKGPAAPAAPASCWSTRSGSSCH